MPPLRGVTTLVREWKLLKAAACHVGCRRCSGLRSYSKYGFCSQEEEEQVLPTAEWYRAAYPRLIKLACALKNVDQVDGRITGIDDDGLAITDDRVISDMQMFKWLARAFVGSPSTQDSMNKTAAAASCTSPGGRTPAGRPREPTTLDSLTRVCNSLNISAQQRKSVRLTVCPLVTQHHIWRAALEEVLKNAGSELQQHAMTVGCSPSIRMAEQIVSSCVQLLAETTGPSEQETPLWMQLAPEKKRAHKPPVQMRKWAEVLEMFEDLSRCLGKEEEKYLTGAAAAVGKIEVMKEGLYQIKDLLVEREIGYKEARRQDYLVQKNLSKNLGHSSKCLFTLLLHYLFGSVRDVEVDAYRFSATDGGHLMVAGKILTSDHERVLQCGLKQVDRALGVSKFVWEAAGSKGGPPLELQGHIWFVGAKERTLMYRGNRFFVHDLRLS